MADDNENQDLYCTFSRDSGRYPKGRNHDLIKKIVYAIGVERAQEFLQKTLEIEAAGGQKIVDGSRRRSPGGMFFYMVRTGLPQEERKQIWSNVRKKKQAETVSESPSTEEK